MHKPGCPAFACICGHPIYKHEDRLDECSECECAEFVYYEAACRCAEITVLGNGIIIMPSDIEVTARKPVLH